MVTMVGRHDARQHWLEPELKLGGMAPTPPDSVTTIISPGRTSRTRSNPMGPKAQSSEATHHSSPPGPARLPSTSGLHLLHGRCSLQHARLGQEKLAAPMLRHKEAAGLGLCRSTGRDSAGSVRWRKPVLYDASPDLMP